MKGLIKLTGIWLLFHHTRSAPFPRTHDHSKTCIKEKLFDNSEYQKEIAYSYTKYQCIQKLIKLSATNTTDMLQLLKNFNKLSLRGRQKCHLFVALSKIIIYYYTTSYLDGRNLYEIFQNRYNYCKIIHKSNMYLVIFNKSAQWFIILCLLQFGICLYMQRSIFSIINLTWSLKYQQEHKNKQNFHWY